MIMKPHEPNVIKNKKKTTSLDSNQLNRLCSIYSDVQGKLEREGGWSLIIKIDSARPTSGGKVLEDKISCNVHIQIKKKIGEMKAEKKIVKMPALGAFWAPGFGRMDG